MLENKKFKLGLYEQNDIFDPEAEVFGLGICVEDEDGEPFAVITVNLPSMFEPNICEVIAFPDAAYIDVNNCPWAPKELENMGIAKNTGFTKQSGFCIYPLYQFNKDWLINIDADIYNKYRTAWNKCFEVPSDDGLE